MQQRLAFAELAGALADAFLQGGVKLDQMPGQLLCAFEVGDQAQHQQGTAGTDPEQRPEQRVERPVQALAVDVQLVGQGDVAGDDDLVGRFEQGRNLLDDLRGQAARGDGIAPGGLVRPAIAELDQALQGGLYLRTRFGEMPEQRLAAQRRDQAGEDFETDRQVVGLAFAALGVPRGVQRAIQFGAQRVGLPQLVVQVRLGQLLGLAHRQPQRSPGDQRHEQHQAEQQPHDLALPAQLCRIEQRHSHVRYLLKSDGADLPDGTVVVDLVSQLRIAGHRVDDEKRSAFADRHVGAVAAIGEDGLVAVEVAVRTPCQRALASPGSWASRVSLGRASRSDRVSRTGASPDRCRVTIGRPPSGTGSAAWARGSPRQQRKTIN